MFGATFLKESLKNKDNKMSLSTAISPTIAVNIYKDWMLFRNGYALPLPPPPEWINTSDIGGHTVLEPKDPLINQLKNIKRISVTILSDKKASGQRFTTPKEFTEWLTVTGEVQGKIQKLDNVIVDKEKAILLMDRTGKDNEWKIIVWVRKEEVNLYINFDGVGTYDKFDKDSINYIISHFTFKAPPSSGKEGKR